MIGNQYFVEMPASHLGHYSSLFLKNRLKAKCLDAAVCGKSALIRTNYVYTSVVMKVQIANLGL